MSFPCLYCLERFTDPIEWNKHMDKEHPIKAPLKERGSLYGDPLNNLATAYNLQDEYYRYHPELEDTQRQRAHDLAMEMVLVKIARIATGKFCEDNYIDAIGYLEIARKLAKGEDTSPENIT